MAQWVHLCALSEAPEPGTVKEVEAAGVAVCLANIEGKLSALDNVCPHRQGPLGQGWVEGNAVVCPWHAWAFDVSTGNAQPPECAHVQVFPLQTENDEILVQLNEN